LKRSNLIFPIHYIDVGDFQRHRRYQCHDPAVLDLLYERKLLPFEEFRHDDVSSPAVRRIIEKLARDIYARLYPTDEPPAEPEMAWIPPGEFMMGTPDAELKRERVPNSYGQFEQPQHRVTLHQGFYLGRYPVTRAEFARFISETGYTIPKGAYTHVQGRGWERSDDADWRAPGFPQTDRDPVTCVSYDDAEAYARWLSGRTGRTYRLPTEAEWEYACRAGTTSARFWGDDRDGAKYFANAADLSLAREMHDSTDPERFFWFDDDYAFTSPVGSFQANPFGVYDMLGNVWEWTADRWHDNYIDAPSDGTAWANGQGDRRRVLRGGSWGAGPWDVRAGSRDSIDANERDSNTGFRLVRTL
jgi:formylglycine-generating enzyme required for sulfatase activity